jgi:predicted nucleic acid-binding protein
MQQVVAERQNPERRPASRRVEALPWVLDTNVVLDLLVFQDPSCEHLARELEARPGRWHSTSQMRNEFDAVLARPGFAERACARPMISRRWADWVSFVEPAAYAAHSLRCRDPDDQIFLELALYLRPSVLLSRDRELLRVDGAAARLGVRIVTPAHFGRAR